VWALLFLPKFFCEDTADGKKQSVAEPPSAAKKEQVVAGDAENIRGAGAERGVGFTQFPSAVVSAHESAEDQAGDENNQIGVFTFGERFVAEEGGGDGKGEEKFDYEIGQSLHRVCEEIVEHEIDQDGDDGYEESLFKYRVEHDLFHSDAGCHRRVEGAVVTVVARFAKSMAECGAGFHGAAVEAGARDGVWSGIVICPDHGVANVDGEI